MVAIISDLAVVQLNLNIINTTENENVFRITMREDNKLCCFPAVFNLANEERTSVMLCCPTSFALGVSLV
jgi:hypothetical protein